MKMKLIIYFVLAMLFFHSCECVNDINTDKENIPEQNSNLFLINLTSTYKNISVYCNEIFIESIEQRKYTQTSKKYLSGNFILNFRDNDEVIFLNNINLVKDTTYFSFLYEINSNLKFSLERIIDKQSIRIWNLSNFSDEITLFNNELLYNYSLNKFSTETIQIDKFPTNFNLIYSDGSQNKNIVVNKRSEIIIYNEQILAFEY